MYATSPISTTTSAIVDFSPLTSAFPPPGVDARAEHQCRDHQQRRPQGCGRLPLRDGQAAVAWRLRSNRNQVLLLRKPVDHVQEQILIALNSDRVVCREVRVADGDETGFRRPLVRLRGILRGIRGVCRGDRADGYWPRLVTLVGVQLDAAG